MIYLDNEKKEAARKIQLALVKCLELSEEDVAWISGYEDSDVIENIRIAIKDGMAIETAKEVFDNVMDSCLASQIRMDFYADRNMTMQTEDLLLAISKRMDTIQDNILNQMAAINKNKEISQLEEKLEQWMECHEKELTPERQEKEVKKGLFRKKDKDKEDTITQLVQKGKFTPEQLAEITKAMNAGLDGDILNEIAKPGLTPVAMKQLCLFYLAKRDAVGTKRREFQELPQFPDEESELNYEDYEDESEDYG